MKLASSETDAKIMWLLDAAHRNNGWAPVDIEQFWHNHDIAVKDPFYMDNPQIPLGVLMSVECVFDELGIKEDYWRYEHDEDWRIQLNTAYNNIAQQVVGRRLLSENRSDPYSQWPSVKTLADLFEAENVWVPGTWSWWLKESAHNEQELSDLLDRVEARLENPRAFLLPENWESEKERLQALGVPLPRYRHQRGPITFATSIYGCENLIYLILDNPTLAERFRNTILRGMLTIAEVIDTEAGDTIETSPRGFSFADDNCYMMTPDMYEFFGYPILKTVFERYAPSPNDWRFQHSDSAMGHLLPILGRLNLKGVNFGPTLTVEEIRKHNPNAIIYGQLAPFTFSRNEEEKMLAEFFRDFEMSLEHRGVVFATAGSINNGSRLLGMRLFMSAIQHFGAYL